MPIGTGSDQSINIVIKARDQASKTLGTVGKKLEAMRPQFQKLALAGTIAFGAIAATTAVAVKEAAKAEGSYNKFNTVFGEFSGDMLTFIKDIRQTMPSATHEIVRMSADLQDLLVPMGLSREASAKMTKGFVTLANQLAAFNDVDPTEVLEAFKSGLAGSSEPLRRFGINALDSSIELEALNTGLLETGQKLMSLDPITRSQVKAQALLSIAVKQSSDAIAGFEANNNSLLRRSQALSATFQEMKVTIGTTLIPIIDSVVKKIAPLIDRLSQWIEANPELTRNIIIVSAAVALLVAGIGLLGLSLLGIMATFTIMVGPIGLVVAAVLGLTFAIRQMNEIWKILESDLDLVWVGIKIMFQEGVNFLIGLAESWANAWVTAVNTIIKALNSIQISIPDWVPRIGGNTFGINIPTVPQVSLPRFEHGGIVNGPAGVPVPIIAHGQERIAPANRSSFGSTNTFVVNINNPSLRNRSDIQLVKEQLEDALRSVVRNNKIQTT